eukprot:6187089-Pleurochrysis_carterae.AAC.6
MVATCGAEGTLSRHEAPFPVLLVSGVHSADGFKERELEASCRSGTRKPVAGRLLHCYFSVISSNM